MCVSYIQQKNDIKNGLELYIPRPKTYEEEQEELLKKQKKMNDEYLAADDQGKIQIIIQRMKEKKRDRIYLRTQGLKYYNQDGSEQYEIQETEEEEIQRYLSIINEEHYLFIFTSFAKQYNEAYNELNVDKDASLNEIWALKECLLLPRV